MLNRSTWCWLDILMPELDGYETLARIKGNSALRHIPVIMISSVEEMDSVVRCIEMGATDYLPKPFTRPCCGPESTPHWPRNGCATWSANTWSR